MFIVSKHEVFMEWFDGLRDDVAKTKIRVAIKKLEFGNFGDHHAIAGAGGLSEIRINYGPGYRIYYTVRGREIVVLLCGGDKSSQKRDTVLAKKLLKEV